MILHGCQVNQKSLTYVDPARLAANQGKRQALGALCCLFALITCSCHAATSFMPRVVSSTRVRGSRA